MQQDEQGFLIKLENKLWTGSNLLLPFQYTAQCIYAVPGLVLLQYVSDSK